MSGFDRCEMLTKNITHIAKIFRSKQNAQNTSKHNSTYVTLVLF